MPQLARVAIPRDERRTPDDCRGPHAFSRPRSDKPARCARGQGVADLEDVVRAHRDASALWPRSGCGSTTGSDTPRLCRRIRSPCGPRSTLDPGWMLMRMTAGKPSAAARKALLERFRSRPGIRPDRYPRRARAPARVRSRTARSTRKGAVAVGDASELERGDVVGKRHRRVQDRIGALVVAVGQRQELFAQLAPSTSRKLRTHPT